ncbi:hypothetical protein CF319_g7133 [Tilletia indica]|nr:hypothetical protein CF319_g7133 [Tilletia indica]
MQDHSPLDASDAQEYLLPPSMSFSGRAPTSGVPNPPEPGHANGATTQPSAMHHIGQRLTEPGPANGASSRSSPRFSTTPAVPNAEAMPLSDRRPRLREFIPVVEAQRLSSSSQLMPIASSVVGPSGPANPLSTPSQPPTSVMNKETMPALVRRVLDAEIGPRFNAAMDAVGGPNVEATVKKVAQHILSGYSQTVAAFHAKEIRRLESRADFPQASSDGYVYFKVNADTLEDYFSFAAETKDQLRSEIHSLEARFAIVERKLHQSLSRSGGYSKRQPLMELQPNAATAAGINQDEMEDLDFAEALSKIKKILARLAGLDDSHFADTKIWHLDWPADGRLPHHPATFRPDELDLKMPSSPVQPNRPRRFRQFRVMWDRGTTDTPNSDWFNPLLEHICLNPSWFGLPHWITVDILRRECFNDLYERMKTKHEAYVNGDLEEAERSRNQEARRRERKKRKLERRRRAAGISTKKTPAADDPDHESALVTGMMSDEYTDDEGTQGPSRKKQKMDGKGKQKAVQDAPPLLCDDIAWRSPECKDYVRSLDAIAPPKRASRDSGKIRSLQANQALSSPIGRWTLEGGWVEEHLHQVPGLMFNRGPFLPLPGAIAKSRESFGSRRRAPPSSAQVSTTTTEPGLSLAVQQSTSLVRTPSISEVGPHSMTRSPFGVSQTAASSSQTSFGPLVSPATSLPSSSFRNPLITPQRHHLASWAGTDPGPSNAWTPFTPLNVSTAAVVVCGIRQPSADPRRVLRHRVLDTVSTTLGLRTSLRADMTIKPLRTALWTRRLVMTSS